MCSCPQDKWFEYINTQQLIAKIQPKVIRTNDQMKHKKNQLKEKIIIVLIEGISRERERVSQESDTH